MSITRHSETFQYGWDHPITAQLYEAFYGLHRRYAEANTHLIEQADLHPDQAVLDFAAGTGRTAEAALPFIGETGRVLCYEPATAMRSAGMERLSDARLSWTATLPSVHSFFDRVLCGAGIWQVSSLIDSLEYLARILKVGGALCFNIPGVYLGQPDRPGGGQDPLLLAFPALFARYARHSKLRGMQLPRQEEIDKQLAEIGLQPRRWAFEIRWTQGAYRDWLKIPPVSDAFLGHMAADVRCKLIDQLSCKVDLASWRWERWIGWTAWKQNACR